MTRTPTIDLDALALLFANRVASAALLVRLGLPASELLSRCERGGPWQRLLPGVLLLAATPPTRAQWARAALCYAGAGAQLTGVDALHLHGMRSLLPAGQVLVLCRRGKPPTDRVRVMATRHPPCPQLKDGFPVAPLPRAATDAARVLANPRALSAVFTEVVTRTEVSTADLRELLPKATAATRQALAVVERPPLAVKRAQELTARLGLPEPRWGPTITTSDGDPLGVADAWWDAPGLAWQFRTGRSASTALLAAGAVVVHTDPTTLRTGGPELLTALARATAQAHTRPRPPLTAKNGIQPTPTPQHPPTARPQLTRKPAQPRTPHPSPAAPLRPVATGHAPSSCRTPGPTRAPPPKPARPHTSPPPRHSVTHNEPQPRRPTTPLTSWTRLPHRGGVHADGVTHSLHRPPPAVLANRPRLPTTIQPEARLTPLFIARHSPPAIRCPPPATRCPSSTAPLSPLAVLVLHRSSIALVRLLPSPANPVLSRLVFSSCPANRPAPPPPSVSRACRRGSGACRRSAVVVHRVVRVAVPRSRSV